MGSVGGRGGGSVCWGGGASDRRGGGGGFAGGGGIVEDGGWWRGGGGGREGGDRGAAQTMGGVAEDEGRARRFVYGTRGSTGMGGVVVTLFSRGGSAAGGAGWTDVIRAAGGERGGEGRPVVFAVVVLFRPTPPSRPRAPAGVRHLLGPGMPPPPPPPRRRRPAATEVGECPTLSASSVRAVET